MLLRRVGRGLGGGVAVLVVAVTSVLVLSAPPASAADEFPPGLDLNVRTAVNRAKTALRRDECNALLSSPTVSAREALDTATPEYVPVPPPPSSSDAVASAVVGGGLNQKIFIHDGFDDLFPGGDRLRFEGRLDIDPFSDRGLQEAVGILHEVGHLTGIERQHEGFVDDTDMIVTAEVEEGLYNTRILNTCFAPPSLLRGSLNCQQTITYFSVYDFRNTLDCYGGCRLDAGPLVLSWSSSFSPTVTSEVRNHQDGEVCLSVRTSICPAPNGISPRPFLTFTATDTAGRSSSDTVVVDCINPWIPVW